MRSLTASPPFFSIKRKARRFARLPRPAPTRFRPLGQSDGIPLGGFRRFVLYDLEQRVSSHPDSSVYLASARSRRNQADCSHPFTLNFVKLFRAFFVFTSSCPEGFL